MNSATERISQLAPGTGPAAGVRSDRTDKARFFAGLVSVVILAVFGTLAAVGILVGLLPAWQGVSITSGSMQPGIVAGDLVLANDAPALIRPGQVVTYPDPRSGELVTHRIVSVNNDGTVTTKGDANEVNDPIDVPVDDIIGAGRLIVPFIGLPSHWASSSRFIPLLAVILLGAAMLYLARFALSDEHDPWPADSS